MTSLCWPATAAKRCRRESRGTASQHCQREMAELGPPTAHSSLSATKNDHLMSMAKL